MAAHNSPSPSTDDTPPAPVFPALDRRSLLVGAGAAGALVVAWGLWPREHLHNLSATDQEHIFNAYLKIGEDGIVTCIVPQCEMGQGVTTLLPQIIADELGADWRSIAVASAPINAVYANTLVVDEDSSLFMPRALVPDAVGDVRRWVRREWAVRNALMITANSSDVRMFEGPCRDAAAQARALLMMAAARRWDVDWQACDTADGFVTYGDKKIRFAQLAPAAAKLTPPAEISYRSDNPNPLVGQEVTRLDLPAKVDGSANYAGDIRLPGMVYAAIRQGPVGDTRLKAINRKRGMAAKGLLHIVTHERWFATVARNWWAANQALDQFAPEFETKGELVSTETINAALDAALKGDGYRMISHGDLEDAMDGRRTITAEYSVAPALHSPMETRTATAAMDGRRLRIWTATQAPSRCRAAVALGTGMSEADISLFPMMAGGSFDACLDHEVAVQAAIIARTVHKPVQLSWSRAEEIMRLPPRPPAKARMIAALNQARSVDALWTRIAVPATTHESRARLIDLHPADKAQRDAAGQPDAAAVVSAQGPYAIPHRAVDHCPADIGLPTGRWRGNADSYTAFFTESFIDELAHNALSDPLSYRMAMLGKSPLLARCLLNVTTLGGWEGGIAGSAQGLACHSMQGSHIAVMATARPSERGLKVEQLVAVVDAGRLVNPNIARQQIEGGLIFGLAAAVGATSDYHAGLATARRLHQLGLPRLAQCPEIIVEFIESDRPSGGVGEIAVPVVAPAIANALFTATGQRIRNIPLKEI
jgi:isoquinoline 1-oxidoreductase beta subunit